MAEEAEIEGKLYEDMISELSDDLLVHILSLVPTKDAVRTMFLSKRWRFVWTMIPKLEYPSGKTKSNFINKSMQLHRAPLLESLCIRLYDDYPIDADVRNWVTYAVERCVRELYLSFFPQWQNLPTCLYSCKTLVKLTLSSNVLVDVPSQPSLPSLGTLILRCAAYKNQDSFVKLLSSCPVLKHLHVIRTCSKDNMISFTVKVPSLETFEYMSFISTEGSSLFIDSPGLKHIDICAFRNHNCSVQNMPRLDVAILHHLASIQNAKFLTSFSSVRFLQLNLTKVVYCNAIKFSRLIGLNIYIPDGSVSYSLDALMLLLHNAPKLKVLMIHSTFDHLTLSWIQPSSIPECLLSHLEFFEWKPYQGTREENQMVAYILRNSKCLKSVSICLSSYSPEERMKMMRELMSMYRGSSSSQLLFFAQLNWRYIRENMY